MTQQIQPNQITPPRVDFLDPRTGKIDRTWYRWFLSLFNTVSGSANVVDSALSTSAVAAIYEQFIRDVAQQVGTLPPNPATQFVENPSITLGDLKAIQDQLQALSLVPPPPQQVLTRFGEFYDTTTQTAALANTAYPVTFNTTVISEGVTVGTTTSQIFVDRPGIYQIGGSGQFAQTGASTSHAWYWTRINGVDVANSASLITLAGTGRSTHASDVATVQMNAGDYVELVWATDDTNIKLTSTAASAPVPGIPCATISVAQLNRIHSK